MGTSYDVYVSVPKIDMIYSQGAGSSVEKTESKVKVKVPGFEAERKETRGGPDTYEKRKAIVGWLRQQQDVSYVSADNLGDDKPYVASDGLPMTWASLGWSADSLVTFWSHSSHHNNMTLALAGSKHNLLGPMAEKRVDSQSFTQPVLRWIFEKMGDEMPDDLKYAYDEGRYPVTDSDISRAIQVAVDSALKYGQNQRFKFVAKVLHRGESVGKKVILATPLYVAFES